MVSSICVYFEIFATICFPVSFLVPKRKLVMGSFVDFLMDNLVYVCEDDNVGGQVDGLIGCCEKDEVGGFVDVLLGGCDDLVSGFVGGFIFLRFFIFLEQLIFYFLTNLPLLYLVIIDLFMQITHECLF